MGEKLALSIVPIEPTRKSSSELSAPASYARESGRAGKGKPGVPRADRSTDSAGFRGPVTSPYTYYPQLTTKSGNCVQYTMLN